MTGGEKTPPIAQDALASQLYASLETMADGFILLDGAWRVTYLNSQIEKLLRRTRTELLGRNIWEMYPHGVGSMTHEHFAKVKEEGGSATFEVQGARLERRFEVRAFASQEGLAVYLRDITDAHATRRRARLLQEAVAQLQDFVMISRLEAEDAVIEFVNPTFTALTGYAVEEAIGRTSHFLRGAKTDLGEIRRIRSQVAAGRSARAELIYYSKGGGEIWLEVNVTPFSARPGAQTHVVTVARDIAARKDAERQLRESTERFRIVAQATDEVVWDWNLLDDTIWWSDAMRARFGYGPEDLPPTSESWTDHIHPDDLQRVTAGIHAVIDGADERWADDYRFMRADGSIAQVMDRGFVIRDAAGKGTRMVGSIVDVTAQRELEAQLRQSQRLEAVGQLTGGVAHDFNNLLTVILSNAELLEMRLAGDERLRMLAEMTRLAAERGAELTSRLLAFSRRQALDPKPADIKALVSGMEPLLRRAVGEQVDIRIAAAEDVWRAHIDTLQLESVLLNLCINARDAMPDGGDLTIEIANALPGAAGEAGDYVLLSVSDTGTGMSEATRARAFEPFFTTKEVGKGSGLGLSMVYGFVTQSKGAVKIDTKIGEGAKVTLYLPRTKEVAREGSDRAVQNAASGRERILLVEDDDLVRAQAGAELRGLGYRVVTARGGAEALEILRAGQEFDLLFTDVVMAGGMNGRQLAEAARALAPHLPVLYTSGHPETVLNEADHIAPGVKLLRKPYRRRELAAKLREAFASSSTSCGGAEH
ncbi:MAG: PAS domain S-box protein [Hyphomonadaceae bacterium]